MSSTQLRPVSAYATLSNMKMLSTVLQGLVEKYDLKGVELGEVNAGAVITHTKDWNLAREATLASGLSASTPAVTMQQACGTSLQAALIASAKIASGQIDSAIAAGSDTVSDVPIVFGKKFSRRLVKLGKAKSLKAKLGVFKGISPKELAPVPLMAKEWGITREAQDELAVASHLNAAAAYQRGFFDDLLTPCEGVVRDNNMRPDSTLEALAGLRTAYDRTDTGTLTAGNSTPLTDGASGVILASEEWAKEHDLPVLAYLTHGQTSAVDYEAGAGLLMAPTVAVHKMLQRANLSLQDFDFYEIHEAFAAQVLCTLKAWEDDDYCKAMGATGALGSIDRSRMNINGSSLAVGHPFAATGGRIIGTLSKMLHEKGSGRGLISVCTAGGMGVTAILEK